MSYCPKCKYNFIDEIKTCPDCNMELIDQVPEDHEVATEWISLTKVTSAVMADMLKEALEENDIICLKKTDMFNSAFAIEATSIAGGDTEIFVPNDKLEKSKNILEQLNIQIAD